MLRFLYRQLSYFLFLLAMLLNTNVKGKGFFRTIFYLPTVVPIVAMAAIWMWIFNPDMGLANNILKAMLFTGKYMAFQVKVQLFPHWFLLICGLPDQQW